MASSCESPALLKVLCIHGYMQSAQAFRERTGAFRKIIKKHAELVFISAPNVVPHQDSEQVSTESDSLTEQLGWWFSREDSYFKAQDPSQCVKGYKESLAVIKEAFEKQGPFDGVLGFSQGASMVSLMCGLQQQEKENPPFKFDFAVLVAGFKSHSAPHEYLYQEPIELPTLHVFGDTDKVIPKDMSEELLQYFKEPETLNHPGGHFIPASGPQKKIYVDFLGRMIEKKKLK